MSENAAALVFGSCEQGAVVHTSRPIGAVGDLLDAAGWRVAELAEAEDLVSFHTEIAAVLGFPDHYGENLDALWDCLTDLEVATALVWSGWEDLAVHQPQDWARLLAVLTERVEDAAYPPFALILLEE